MIHSGKISDLPEQDSAQRRRRQIEHPLCEHPSVNRARRMGDPQAVNHAKSRSERLSIRSDNLIAIDKLTQHLHD